MDTTSDPPRLPLLLHFTSYLIERWKIFSKVLDRVCVLKSLPLILRKIVQASEHGFVNITGVSNDLEVAPLVDNNTSLNDKSNQNHSQKFQEAAYF